MVDFVPRDRSLQKAYCHPVVIIKVNGVKCRALLHTGAFGSYVSAFLMDLLKIFLVDILEVKPSRTLARGIKTIMGGVSTAIGHFKRIP